jgi:hypothetical protein
MASFNPVKLFVHVIPPATSFQPIEGRKLLLLTLIQLVNYFWMLVICSTMRKLIL